VGGGVGCALGDLRGPCVPYEQLLIPCGDLVVVAFRLSDSLFAPRVRMFRGNQT
jgi:hypothetical protein